MFQPDVTEVDAWCVQSQVDEAAASRLKQCSPEVWSAVMARGDLSTARNPSATLLARVRDATRGSGGGSGTFSGSSQGQVATLPTPVSADEIELFLATHAFDERAISAFRSLSPMLQAVVIGRGDLSSARNPSAALFGRIGEARKAPIAPEAMQVYGAHDVEEFIAGAGIDDVAANALRMSPPLVQFAVIARGTTEGARSASALVLSRIKDANKRDNPSQKSQGTGSQMTQMQAFQQLAAMGGFGWGHAPAPARPSPVVQSRGPPKLFPPTQLAGPAATPAEAQAFLTTALFDEKACETFLALSPEGQAMVIGRGNDLSNTRNPSAALASRIRDVMRNTNAGVGGNVIVDEGSVEMFILENALDEMATEKMRTAPPDIQQAIMARGAVSSARNPSATLLSRLGEETRKSRGGRGPGGGGGAMSRGPSPGAAPIMDPQQAALMQIMASQGMGPSQGKGGGSQERHQGYMEGMMQAMQAMQGMNEGWSQAAQAMPGTGASFGWDDMNQMRNMSQPYQPQKRQRQW